METTTLSLEDLKAKLKRIQSWGKPNPNPDVPGSSDLDNLRNGGI